MRRLPTVNDLRVKECYICREEEVYDSPARPPKRWVHPCKCTLIAHEDCLLEWIRTSENNPDKPLSLILKCPQCGERYSLESENPIILRLLDFGNRIMQKCGTAVTVLSVAGAITSLGTGIYIVSAGYGLYAVESFIGEEMYDLILGDKIEKWPIPAFITLPLIPLSLILSKTQKFRDSLPLATLMSLWPSLPRIDGAPQQQGLLSFLGVGSRAANLPQIKFPASTNRIASDLFRDLIFSWPPSPFMFNIGLKLVRSAYNRRLEGFRRSVLGDVVTNGEGAAARDGIVVDDFRMELRFEEREEDEQGDEEPVQQDQPVPAAHDQPDQLRDDNNVRLLLENAEEVPAAADGRRAAPLLVDARPQPDGGQHQIGPPNPARPAEEILAGRVRQAVLPANQAPDQRDERGGNAGAGVRLRMTSTYIGNIVGSALIVPPLASFAGSTLLRLALPQAPNAHATLDFRGYSAYSPRRLLCRFLSVRPPGSAPKYTLMGMYAFREDMSPGQLMRAVFLLSCRAMVVGTPAWTESDPVWWRNVIGLGIFYVAKDMVSIWYQYLSQREIRSRRVEDRAFEGIDPAQLDLKPESRDIFRNSSRSD